MKTYHANFGVIIPIKLGFPIAGVIILFSEIVVHLVVEKYFVSENPMPP
jgi:hypothetical protein